MTYKNGVAIATVLKALEDQTVGEEGYKFLKIEKEEEGENLNIRIGFGEKSKTIPVKIDDESTLYPEIYDTLCLTYGDPKLSREGSATPGYTMRADFESHGVRSLVSIVTNSTPDYDWSERYIQDQLHEKRESDRGMSAGK